MRTAIALPLYLTAYAMTLISALIEAASEVVADAANYVAGNDHD